MKALKGGSLQTDAPHAFQQKARLNAYIPEVAYTRPPYTHIVALKFEFIKNHC